MAVDTVLENARIVDGTGAPWFRGHVGISDGLIDEVSRGTDHDLTADTAVDVDGDVLCPGFVDAHSKSDSEPFDDRTLEPKIRQGITTEIIGHDGYSMAPFYRDDLDEWRTVLGGIVRGIDDDQWVWEDTAEFLDTLADRGVAPNIGTLVGHGTVRYNVMGLSDHEPSARELEEMADLVEECLEDGALGLSTGLIYPPQMYSDSDELRTLAARLSSYGRPLIAHVRSQGRGVWDAIDELYDLSVEEGVPVQHTHIQLSGGGQGGKADTVLRVMAAARERGGDVSANQHPYTAGSTRMGALLPPRFQSMDSSTLVEQLRSDQVREAVRRDIEEWRIDGWENLAGLTGWDDIHVASVKTAENRDLEGRSLSSIASDRSERPVDVMCDVLVEEDFEVDVLLHKLSESDIRTFLADERISVCTDGLFGDNPHPRTYGTYPRILNEYVYEADLLSLEETIRKMTSLPARQYGLDRRGLIRPEMKADLTVFDPTSVAGPATYENPTRPPKGIPHVLVNGEFVVREGDVTGETPGDVIRH